VLSLVQQAITSTAFVGDLTGNASGTAATVTTAAQTAITSVGTLTALQVDNINIDGNAITSTAGVDLTITPLAGQQIVLDGAIVIDAGVVTGITALNGGQLGGRRNIMYNGAMNVAQRSASVAGLGAASGYFTLDRVCVSPNATAGRFTMAQVADGPAGFANCMQLSCTTADTSIAASEFLLISQFFEGQDLQQIKKGTASAEQLTVSFWVKGNASATYVVELYDSDNTRQISKTFAVTTSWAKITLTYPADATGAFDDDNASSLQFNIWLHAGSDFTSGTLNSTAWAAATNANRAVGISSFFDSTDRTFFMTGVQMELGPTATEFEYRTYGEELALCQRYFQKAGANSIFRGQASITGVHYYWMPFNTQMRAAPTMSVGSPSYSNALNAGFFNTATQGSELSVNISSTGGYAFIPWTAVSEI
jgi:hypothetical protein